MLYHGRKPHRRYRTIISGPEGATAENFKKNSLNTVRLNWWKKKMCGYVCCMLARDWEKECLCGFNQSEESASKFNQSERSG